MKPIVAAYITRKNRHREDDDRRYDRERPDTMRGDWPIRQEYDRGRGNRPDSHGGYDRPYGHEPDSGEEYGMKDYRRYPDDGYGRVESRYRPIRGDYEDDRRGGLYDGGDIGFGAERERYQPARSHYQDGQQREHGKPLRAGGTFWMEPAQENQKTKKLDKQTGEKWVRHMRDDKDEPIKAWSAEELKTLARRYGVEPSGEHFEDFYVTIHMMRSDFGAVAREFDVDTPAFYAALADAWLKDPDAAIHGHDKLEAHYCCIVKANK